jgi:hypothetical protein
LLFPIIPCPICILDDLVKLAQRGQWLCPVQLQSPATPSFLVMPLTFFF